MTQSDGWAEPADTSMPSAEPPLSEQPIHARKLAGAAEDPGRQSTDVLVAVLAERYPDIGEHLDEVARLSAEVAEELALPGEDRVTVVQAASLHDIGKVAIPDKVLSKPSRLDAEEWEYILEHTVIGQRILDAAPALATASKLVRWSHERWDGDGYPDAIGGSEIPLGARIVAVCDAYDAMTSARPYAEPRSPQDAIEELRKCAGTQFDPDVVEAFARVIERAEQASALT